MCAWWCSPKAERAERRRRMKKVRAMLSPVNTMKIEESESPITAAKTRKKSRAVAGCIRCTIAESPNTKASGASMMTHLSGLT